MRYLLGLLACAAYGQVVYQRTITDHFGVPHEEQPIELPRTGVALSASGHRMIGPSGNEVPWQPLSSGGVLVQSRMPASRLTLLYKADAIVAGSTVRINRNLLTKTQPRPGDTIVFSPTAPGGMMANQVYYLRSVAGDGINYAISANQDLSDTVTITSNPGVVNCYRPGFIVDGPDLYAFAHGYQTGDVVQVRSQTTTGAVGTLPTGLAPATNYWVIAVSANKFRLATSRANALAGTAIATSGGSGLHTTIVSWTWSLEVGTPTVSPASPVVMSTGTNFEITNGLTGVRVVTTGSNASPFQLAPIQGVRLSDGTWTATGPNRLYSAGTTSLVNFMTSYTATVVEDGPLLKRVTATYTLNRPLYAMSAFDIQTTDIVNDRIQVTAFGQGNWATGNVSMSLVSVSGGVPPCGLSENIIYWPVFEAGSFDNATGLFRTKLSLTKGGPPIDLTCPHTGTVRLRETMALPGPGQMVETISVYAGQKSILIDTELGAQIQYYLNLRSAGVFEPNQARWRGHYASSIACGRRADGSVNGPTASAYSDSLVDLPTTAVSGLQCIAGTLRQAPKWSLPTSGIDTGYYWFMFNSAATGASPLAGYYVGRNSRIDGTVNNGPGIYTAASHFTDNTQHAGITMFALFRDGSGTSTSSARREWAIYTGPTSEMTAQTAVQPIALDKNKVASINLTRLANYTLSYGDPAGGWPAPFTDRSIYDALVTRIQTDAAYRTSFLASNADLSPLVDMWIDATPTSAEVLVSSMEQYVAEWHFRMNQEDSVFNIQWNGYPALLNYQAFFVRGYAVLNSPIATSAQKARVKAVIAYAAEVIWDPDYAPLDANTNEGLGNANQVLQFIAYRQQHCLALGVGGIHAPCANPARTTIMNTAMDTLMAYIQTPPAGGAPRGSTWYYITGMDPAISNLLLRKYQGADNSQYLTALRGFGRWMNNALTPPEPRFGNRRKHVSSGNGNTGARALPGVHATLMRGIDSVSSNQSQWNWLAQGKPFGQFTAPVGLVADENAAASTPPLTSEDYRNYWSVLRHSAHTPNETAAWFTKGFPGWYTDHREIDPGQVSIYAHNAPLSIDWNANLYYPITSGGFSHNRAVWESDLAPTRWNSDSPSMVIGNTNFFEASSSFSGLPMATNAEVQFLGSGTTQASTNATWVRSVSMLGVDPAHPIIVVRDRFTGTNSGRGKVISWAMMATGDVTGTQPTYSPVTRLQVAAVDPPTVLPSTGPERMTTGIDRLRFTGQTWAAHPTGGIDWDLYILPTGRASWFIGNWGHSAHNGDELAQYLAANGQPFREQQHILRVLATGDLTTVIAPFRKGEAPASRTVTQENCGLQVVQPSQTVCVSDRSYVGSTSSTQAIGSFDGSQVTAYGLTIERGPAEIAVTGTSMSIALSGAAGTRTISVPDGWSTPAGWTRVGNRLTIEFDGTAATFAATR